MKKEDLRSVEYEVFYEVGEDDLRIINKKGYFHLWLKDKIEGIDIPIALVEDMETGLLEEVDHLNIRFLS